MKRYTYRHLENRVLRQTLVSAAGRGFENTAEVVGLIAEFDGRDLYAEAGYPSMLEYCVQELHFSEDAALRRIRAARAARRFPAILPALANGSLSLTAVVQLNPYLSAATGDELLAAAAWKRKSEIELLLAERFPKSDLPARVELLPTVAFPKPDGETRVDLLDPPATSIARFEEVALAPVAAIAPRIEPPAPRPKVTPLAPGRYAVQFTFSEGAYDKLRQAEALLGHQVRPGNTAELFERALDALIAQLEKSKFAATDRPRSVRRASSNPRHIPAHVKRKVRERDGDQCTFVSDTGHRCEARAQLEFDHAEEVARGGKATVSNIRLRCRTHNQFTAKRAFGAGFMEQKRDEARRAATERCARIEELGTVTAEERAAAAEDARTRALAAKRAAREANEKAYEVIPWLRDPGFHAEESREERPAT